ncbi:MAG TPA: copper chaperone PCu(A)C [Rhizomicrobium sp.]|nr:copper chaperone PCu(A)C [Rhizomicrobium sp.]
MKRLGVAILLMSSVTAQAAPFDVRGAWFRSLPGKLPAGGYFTVQNNTGREVAITGASSDACGMLMIHQSSNKGGMTSMMMMEEVKVPAGGKIAFAPGGYHLMCEAPKMKIGAKVPVTLHLAGGNSVAVAFEVRGASGR